MNKAAFIICLTIGCFIILGCSDLQDLVDRDGRKIDRCEKLSISGSDLGKAYRPLTAQACVSYLEPYDQSLWWEAPLNSRRVRNEAVFRVGCTHCPESNRDCDSLSNCGGCGTASLHFDFTRMPEDAEIVVARLAIHAVENVDRLKYAHVVGRVNVGGDFAVISQQPEIQGNWAFFDITNFACRTVVERRNSANIEISLPCGPEKRSAVVSAVGKKDLGPQVVFEYR